MSSLVCVGTGMTLGAHITPICRNHIEQADVVFHLAASGPEELWLQQMNKDVRSLQPHYVEGRDRRIGYREMVDAIISEVKNGKNVVGAFYGHPGIFALVPHKAIEKCHKLGFPAKMLPGISAEACLYADLGIDPGRAGCQQYEASQFMFYKRQIDTSAYLLLWQIGIAGDKSHAKFSTNREYRGVLLSLLRKFYPLDHQVALYECPNNALDSLRVEWIPLSSLPSAEVTIKTTLVIPPCSKMQENTELLEQLALLDN